MREFIFIFGAKSWSSLFRLCDGFQQTDKKHKSDSWVKSYANSFVVFLVFPHRRLLRHNPPSTSVPRSRTPRDFSGFSMTSRVGNDQSAQPVSLLVYEPNLLSATSFQSQLSTLSKNPYCFLFLFRRLCMKSSPINLGTGACDFPNISAASPGAESHTKVALYTCEGGELKVFQIESENVYRRSWLTIWQKRKMNQRPE